MVDTYDVSVGTGASGTGNLVRIFWSDRTGVTLGEWILDGSKQGVLRSERTDAVEGYRPRAGDLAGAFCTVAHEGNAVPSGWSVRQVVATNRRTHETSRWSFDEILFPGHALTRPADGDDPPRETTAPRPHPGHEPARPR